MRYKLLMVPVVIVLSVTLFHPPLSLGQSCNRRAKITSHADVFALPPRFITGVGWKGTHQARLTRDTQVYMCAEERIVEFGLSKRVWVKIAYRDRGSFQFGWVLKENVTNWHASRHDGSSKTRFGFTSFIAVAHASDLPVQARQQPEWKLGEPPTEISPAGDNESAALGESRAAAAPLHDLFSLYAPLFIAMLFGMFAKAAVDWLDAPDTSVLRQHLRNAITAFLVSPIVFLGFVNAGQFSVSQQTFIVLCLLAFQNGFFWQTVLKKDSPREKGDTTAAAGATQRRFQEAVQ